MTQVFLIVLLERMSSRNRFSPQARREHPAHAPFGACAGWRANPGWG
jgi:hypothetical protein